MSDPLIDPEDLFWVPELEDGHGHGEDDGDGIPLDAEEQDGEDE